MTLDHSLVGVPGEPHERSWTSADALLYAVGVGAGLGDPLRELEFTTENSEGITQQVLPTYAVLISQARPQRSLGDFDRALLVHAEQAFTLHRPLPVAGTVRTVATVTGIYDKRSGALVVTENVATDVRTGELLVTARSGTFIRGEGGFGGDGGQRDAWQRPDRAPEAQVVLPTRPEQALIYRLSGDRNPLHADPKFAARGGFSRPILHGLCSYGVTGRALLHEICAGDPARFAAMSGRFTRPVYPGDTLTVSVWLDDAAGEGGGTRSARFQTATQDGAVVIDRGEMQYRPAAASAAQPD
ncbi:MAG TPA: MaoC/PaaZ C-terminal domain-containing protein [Streptosporangiaceae bacterium]